MEWGIINEENFTDIEDIPIKRWDPLSTVKIDSQEYGKRSAFLRYYGHYSYISPIRGVRPQGYNKREDWKDCKEEMLNTKDVFMAEVEGRPIQLEAGQLMGDGYTIMITEDEQRRDSPFLDVPHVVGPISPSTKAMTLINRYPSMARVIDPTLEKSMQERLEERSKIAMGINLVSISRDFYPSMCFNLIPEEVLASIFSSMKAAIIYCVENAIGRDYYDITVNPFFNIGKLVGGSQPRIHSQVYIDLSGDGHGSRLEGFLEAFNEMGNNCHLCKSSHGGNASRMVLETKYWIYFMTGSPVRNYHLRFHPKEHIRRFSKLNINQIKDLARSLKSVFKALDALKVNRNRNILFNTCPFGYDADFHFFGDIISHEIIGGAEMADDMRVARKRPENCAKEMRDIIQQDE